MNHQYRLQNFMPLIIILCIIIGLTMSALAITNQRSVHEAMRYFMAFFFLLFGSFKLINIRAFAQAFSMYDLIAQRSKLYGYIYPFIELALGMAYLVDGESNVLHLITLCIMIISAAGVLKALMKGDHLVCACLGIVFKIPMTYVTLAEDLIMAAMAGLMLCNF